MPDDPDTSALAADDAPELAYGVEAWLRDLAILRDTLQTVRDQRGSAHLEEWAAVRYGIDHVTLRDFLAFDGTIESVTERMMSAFQRVVNPLG